MGNSVLTRVLSRDGSAMVVAANTTDIVAKAHDIHSLSKTMTAALGRALTAASIMGSMLKSDNQSLTLKFSGDGPGGTLCCVSDYHGNVRGYADNPDAELPPNAKGKLDVGGVVGKGPMYVLRDLGMEQPYVGVAQIVSGEIAEDITNYYASSEQTPTVCGLGVLVNRDFTCRAAGGFMVQLLPFADEETVKLIEQNIEKIDPVSKMIDDGLSNIEIIERIFDGIPFDVLDTADIDYKCNCNRDRYERALLSLGKKELAKLYSENRPVETCCNFCNKKYVFELPEIAEMIKSAK